MPRVRLTVSLALLLAAAPLPSPAAEEWTRVPSPNAIDGYHNFLQGLDCVGPDDCWAVGYDTSGAQRTLTMHWDGSAWSLVPSPNPSGHSIIVLSSVGCAASSDCWAVGFAYDGLAYRALSLRWDGQAWTLVAQPASSATGSDLLYDVTCVSSSDCWAAGITRAGALGGVGPNQTLIRHWDGGAWTTVGSPNSLPAQGNQLVSVDCVAADDCWAVGSYAAPAAGQTLTLRWRGQAWERVPSPNTGPEQRNALNGVTCVSSHDCWAVGISSGQADQALAMRWDGASWSLVPIPSSAPDLANVLFDVSCQASTECWAVGYQRESSWLVTLIERWDGERWQIVPSPNSKYGETNLLTRVDCAPAECWTAGYHYGTGSIARTMALRRQGQPPASGPAPGPPHIVDLPGDANLVNSQGLDQALDVATDPASIAGADLLGVWFETTYDTVVERDEQGAVRFVRHVPTGLRMRVTTTEPAKPTFGPTLTYRVPLAIGPSCRAWLFFDVRGEAPGSLDREGAGILPQSGCEGTTTPTGASLAFEGNRSIATFPFAGSGGLLATGVELRAWSRPSVRVAVGSGTQQLLTAPAIDEAPPMSSFTIGSDVPPDIDCLETPGEPVCAG